MDRRRFGLAALGSLTGLAAAGGAEAAAATTTAPPARAARRQIKPHALRAGDTIGLIAPSGILNESAIDKALANVEALGFKAKLGANVRAARGGYAGTIGQRLDDLHAMFLDREVAAIWTLRGGSGASGLLPHLRFDLIRRHPKIFIGYSDITALHLAIFRRAGLVTFHGPVASSTLSDYSRRHLLAVLMDPQPTTLIPMAAEHALRAAAEPQFALRTLNPGIAEGRLLGGNLSLLCALIGTPWAAEPGRRLLFLEDVGEAPYRLDRMLTQLEQSLGAIRPAGVMLGIFQKCVAPEGEATLTLEQVFDDHFGGRKQAAVSGFSFGHVAPQFTLPMGVRARLDTEARTLTLLEAAVVA